MTLKAYIEDVLMNFLTLEYTVMQCRDIQRKTLLFGLGQIKIRNYFKKGVHILYRGGTVHA
jgi:hypothetical protein